MSVWVVAEFEQGLPARVTFELLTAGRGLADALGVALGVLLVGSGVAPYASQLIRLGADRVAVADHPGLAPEAREAVLGVAGSALMGLDPGWVLAGATRLGTELLARLAVRLEVGLVTGCATLEVSPDGVAALRPLADGGTARVLATGQVGLATLLAGRHGWPVEDPHRTGEIRALEVPGDMPSGCRLIEATPVAVPRPSEAAVLVVGGPGAAGHWPLLEQLASLLGGVVGATREVVHSGARPASELIGLTEPVRAPRLVVACGLSGTPEPWAGILAAERLVAIDPESDSDLMRRADLAILAPLQEVLPPWIEALAAARTDR